MSAHRVDTCAYEPFPFARLSKHGAVHFHSLVTTLQIYGADVYARLAPPLKRKLEENVFGPLTNFVLVG